MTNILYFEVLRNKEKTEKKKSLKTHGSSPLYWSSGFNWLKSMQKLTWEFLNSEYNVKRTCRECIRFFCTGISSIPKQLRDIDRYIKIPCIIFKLHKTVLVSNLLRSSLPQTRSTYWGRSTSSSAVGSPTWQNKF